MGFGYALPGREVWDPLGSWAARLPSALATLGLMLGLADTVLRWPFPGDARPRLTALIAPLAFAFSPLVLVWSRTAVSDALLCGLLVSACCCSGGVLPPPKKWPGGQPG